MKKLKFKIAQGVLTSLVLAICVWFIYITIDMVIQDWRILMPFGAMGLVIWASFTLDPLP